VSSFTSTFFGGDDPSGTTLYGHKLSDLAEKSQLLGYLGVTGKINGFLLPEPVHEAEKKDWIYMKYKLLDMFENNRVKK
jgi:hypothetical protein